MDMACHVVLGELHIVKWSSSFSSSLFFFSFEINNLLHRARRQSMVAKRVQGTTTLRCTLYMHLLHYLSMRQRSAGTKRKEWLLIEKGRWPSFQHMYLPCQLHSYSTFHALIKQPSHITCKITDTILSTPVRPSFRKAPVTSTMSQSSMWKGQGQFMLSQSLLVGLPRITSLTRCRWEARCKGTPPFPPLNGLTTLWSYLSLFTSDT